MSLDPILSLVSFVGFLFGIFSFISFFSLAKAFYQIITNDKNGFTRFQTGKTLYEESTRLLLLVFTWIGGWEVASLIDSSSYVTGPFFLEAIALVVAYAGSPALISLVVRERERAMVKKADSAPTRFKVGVLGVWPESPKLPPLSVNDEINVIENRTMGWRFTAIVANHFTKQGQITSLELKRQLGYFDKQDAHILHVGAHATTQGIHMFEGICFADQFAEYVRNLELFLVVLLVCDGDEIAKYLLESEVCRTVIFSTTPLADKLAVQIADKLYADLRSGSKVADALQACKSEVKLINLRAAHSLRVIGDQNLSFNLAGVRS